MTIIVKYSCHGCGLTKVDVAVPARESEDVVTWMDQTVRLAGADHRRRSPHCHPKAVQDLMIPMTGRDRIGGPPVQ